MFFGKKTTASVMTAFSKTLTDLEEVEREHQAEAERQEQAMREAQAAAEAARDEVKIARDTMSKFNDLLGPLLARANGSEVSA